MYQALRRRQIAQAQQLAADLMNLTVALFRETSPAPLKYALSLLGLMSPRVRLPLVEPSPDTKAQIVSALRYAGDGIRTASSAA
jgi:4-hydroxy-tetrahydrodipicolinate synthase